VADAVSEAQYPFVSVCGQLSVLRVGSGTIGVGTCGSAVGQSRWAAAYHSERMSVNPFFMLAGEGNIDN
jgi:hypothetical protein